MGLRAVRASREIAKLGYAVLKLDTNERDTLRSLLASADVFFANTAQTKRRYSGRAANHGFRPFGIEYSITPEQPDYNECFTLWSTRVDLLPHREEIEPFVACIGSWQKVCGEIARGLLTELAAPFATEAPGFSSASCLQINHCLPAPPKREFLQDRHEDGHILTVLHATDRGLEICADGLPVPVELDNDEVLVFSGSILTALTRGAIAPTFHQVRNYGLSARKSVMYFVNPALDSPVRPWVPGGSHVDLRDIVRSNPSAFGLPPVEEF